MTGPPIIRILERSDASVLDSVVARYLQAVKAGESLQDISSSSILITDMNNQIATSAEQQNVVASDISGNIESIAAAAEQTTTGAAEVASASENIAQQAAQLLSLMNKFQLQDDLPAQSDPWLVEQASR